MDGLGQSTDVGESHRSMGHLVMWSPLIRLWPPRVSYTSTPAQSLIRHHHPFLFVLFRLCHVSS